MYVLSFPFISSLINTFSLQCLHRLLLRLTSGRRFSLESRGNGVWQYHHHHFPRLSPALSGPSIQPELSSEDSDDSEDSVNNQHQRRPSGVTSVPVVEEVPLLRKLIDKFDYEMEKKRSEYRTCKGND